MNTMNRNPMWNFAFPNEAINKPIGQKKSSKLLCDNKYLGHRHHQGRNGFILYHFSPHGMRGEMTLCYTISPLMVSYFITLQFHNFFSCKIPPGEKWFYGSYIMLTLHKFFYIKDFCPISNNIQVYQCPHQRMPFPHEAILGFRLFLSTR